MKKWIDKDVAILALRMIKQEVWLVDIPSPTIPEYIEHHEQMQHIMRVIDVLIENISTYPIWNKVSDGLPQLEHQVLTIDISDFIKLGEFQELDGITYFYDGDFFHPVDKVKAWLELPEYNES